MGEVNSITRKSTSNNLSSIIFLVVVIISTISLYLFNNYLTNEVEKLKISISTIKSNIVEVEKDKNLQVYSLLELNKQAIYSYELMNKVTSYINHMNVIQWKYNLEFAGFNISKWEINTNVKIVSDNNSIAYQKTRDFINKYRTDPKALFDLSFINSVEWMDNITFKVNFKIK